MLQNQENRLFAKAPQLLDELKNWRAKDEFEEPRDTLARVLSRGNLQSPIFDDVASLARNAVLAFDNKQISEDQLVSMLLYRGALVDYPGHTNFMTHKLSPDNKQSMAVLREFLTIQKDLVPGMQEKISDDQIQQIILALQDKNISASERVFITLDVKDDELFQVFKRILEVKFHLLMPIKIEGGYRIIVPSFSLIKKVLTTLKPDGYELIPSLGEVSDQDVLAMHFARQHPFGLAAWISAMVRIADRLKAGDFGFAMHDLYHIVLIMFVPNMPLIFRIAEIAQRRLATGELNQGQAEMVQHIIAMMIDAEFRQTTKTEGNPLADIKTQSSQAGNLLQILLRVVGSAFIGQSAMQRTLAFMYDEEQEKNIVLIKDQIASAQTIVKGLLADIMIDLINNASFWQDKLSLNPTDFFDLIKNNGGQLSMLFKILSLTADETKKSIFGSLMREEKMYDETQQTLTVIQEVSSKFIDLDSSVKNTLTEQGLQLVIRYTKVRKEIIKLITEGNTALLKELLSKDPSFNCNYFDDDGLSPLQIAAKLGHAEIIDLLVAHGAIVDLTRNLEPVNTPLVLAVENRHEKALARLLEHKASFLVTNEEKTSIVDICISNGFVQGLLILLQKTSVSNFHIDYLFYKNLVHPNCVEILKSYQKFKSDYAMALNDTPEALVKFLENHDQRFSLNTLLESSSNEYSVETYDYRNSDQPSSSEDQFRLKKVSPWLELLPSELLFHTPYQKIYTVQSLKLLQQKGVDINSQDEEGNTALHTWLKQIGENDEKNRQSVLRTDTYLKMAKLALDGGANFLLPNKNGYPALALAMVYAQELVPLMLKDKADISGMELSDTGVISLINKIAQQNGTWKESDLTVFEYWISKKLNLNTMTLVDLDKLFGKQSLFLIESKKYTNISLWSLLRGYPIFEKPKGFEAFFSGLIDKKITGEVNIPLKLRQLCIANGADPHAKGLNGETELHAAAKNNWSSYAESLISVHGLNVNSADANGNTPLHLALANGNSETACLLMQLGANPLAINSAKQTPFVYAKFVKEEKEKQASNAAERMRVSIQAATHIGHYASSSRAAPRDSDQDQGNRGPGFGSGK